MLYFYIKPEWLQYLAELENRNNHTLRLIEIARECEKQAEGDFSRDNFAAIRKCLEKNLAEHDRAGELTEELYTIRRGLTLYLREQIGRHYGDMALKAINP